MRSRRRASQVRIFVLLLAALSPFFQGCGFVLFDQVNDAKKGGDVDITFVFNKADCTVEIEGKGKRMRCKECTKKAAKQLQEQKNALCFFQSAAAHQVYTNTKSRMSRMSGNYILPGDKRELSKAKPRDEAREMRKAVMSPGICSQACGGDSNIDEYLATVITFDQHDQRTKENDKRNEDMFGSSENKKKKKKKDDDDDSFLEDPGSLMEILQLTKSPLDDSDDEAFLAAEPPWRQRLHEARHVPSDPADLPEPTPQSLSEPQARDFLPNVAMTKLARGP